VGEKEDMWKHERKIACLYAISDRMTRIMSNIVETPHRKQSYARYSRIFQYKRWFVPLSFPINSIAIVT